jgi:acylphosphatase
VWDHRPMGQVLRVRVRVTGRVQGVFFRATAARTARALGVSGWIANGPDGAVEAAFEGPPGAIEDLVAWCRRGPEHARVEGVEVTDETPTGETGFRVVR